MKIKVLAIVVAVLLLLVGCSQKSEDNNAKKVAEAVITDLGISSAENEASIANARNPWDMAVIDGEVYTAVGDYESDLGMTSLWKYDAKQSKWINSGDVAQEAVIRILNLNGQYIAIGADPAGRPEYAENYVLKDGKWEVFAKIKGALHTFDAEYFDNAYYFAVSYQNDEYPIVKYIPDKEQYEGIALYKNGTDVIAALGQTPNVKYKRVYDLFCVNENLYCAFSCSYTDGKITMEFFKLNGDKFEFCQAFKMSGMQMNRPVKNQIFFNSSAVFGGICYLSTGNLYKTNDFNVFDKIVVPDNACVTDLLVEQNGDDETLYVLATVQNGEKYKSTIYSLDENKLNEIYSVEQGLSALSFAKEGNKFYVGLGGDFIESQEIGRVLQIELS